ncbi:hypothetical protein [Vibrio cholerae]|uniref:Uncharacterized protein n=3 Tax=Vibrio cholerae TaxID=666 RepID=A0A544IC70_VIBCL|nr:hypothetical protein [Vibrio cholerae]EEO04518.1 hypothetical protein VCA_003567 [Vibrio cholerae VL426]EJL6330710.1 hypothetical protein [Vibrio cholerae]MCD6670366.1 hypothetical protein [Vibrio cholerae]PAS37400.1 hypothetical protein CGT70_10810 [Vibrio cholerae]PNM50455.1 hypothetical protein AL535_013445 [Vibrio cholerae]
MSNQRILDFLENQKVEVNDEDLYIKLIPPATQEELQNHIVNAGYINNVRPFEGKYQIKTGSRYWNRGKFIFTSDESLFEECDTQSKVPEGLLYFDKINNKLIKFNSELDLHNKLEIFVELRNLLTKLSDHMIPNEEVIFLIKNDNGGVKHRVPISLDYESFAETFTNQTIELKESVRLLGKLQQKISLDDAQDKERRNCMRSAFDVLIQGLDEEKEIFTHTLANIVSFYKKYTEHHNMFLSDFTINKVIQEINAKDLEYTGKINDIASSVQTKALAIPGAMVAITAVMKVDNMASAIGVVVALLLTCLVIQKSLDIYNDTFKHLSKQINNVFSRYQILSQKSEVRNEAKITEQALNKLIEKGERGLNYVSRIIWTVWITSILFVIFEINNINKPESEKIINIPNTSETGKENTHQNTTGIIIEVKHNDSKLELKRSKDSKINVTSLELNSPPTDF